MTVTVSRKLNIVLPPIETSEGTVYVHSIPIGRSLFEQCFRPMARALSNIVSEGSPFIGPNVAKLYLLAEADAIGEGDKVRGAMMSEIKRLTNVGIAGKNEVVPYAVAVQRNLLDEDKQAEVENFIVYFTLVSWIKLPAPLEPNYGKEALHSIWQAQTTSSELMEFMRGLPTSTPAEPIGEKTPSPKTKVVPASSLAA